MNKFIKLIVPLLALTGIILSAFAPLKSIGLLIIFILTPIFLIYVLINLKSEINHFNTKLRNVLIPTVLLNTIFIVLQVLFKIQHYPGASLFKLIGAILSVLSLIVGLIYFIKNRKNKNTTFTYELILVLYPAFIFIWQLIPYNVPPQLNQEYVKMINTSIKQTEITNLSIVDSTCLNPNIEFIRELKKDVIMCSGGLDESGEIYGFYNKTAPVVILKRKVEIQKLPIAKELIEQLLNVRIAGDAVFILTQIENKLITKNCLQQGV